MDFDAQSDLEDEEVENLDLLEASFDEVTNSITAFQEDEQVKEALARGVDLRQYAKEVEQELGLHENEHNRDYMEYVASFVTLDSEIKSCDAILENMEDLLNAFQSDLGTISSEIQTLQERSSHMNIKLKNRKVVNDQLQRVLDGVVLAPYMIRKISDAEVDEVWLQYLLAVNRQMAFVHANRHKKVKAIKDIMPEMERLKFRAITTIRDYFIGKIRSLRVPNANVQIVQQSAFLKYKELYAFVASKYPPVAEEIQTAYMFTMRWYFSSHFERYAKGLGKLQTVVADKADLLGSEETLRKPGIFSTAKTRLKDKANVFALGDRIDILRQTDAGVILPHRYSYEQLFRSFNLTLIDNASSEYLFLYEFFAKRDEKSTADLAKDIFQEIFASTEKLGYQLLKQYVDNTLDAIGILLCIRINTTLAMELQRRRVPTLENYTNSLNMLLWPRFTHIIDLNVESMRKLAQSKQILQGSNEIHAHSITRRYAEFLASIFTLNEDHDDQILNNSVNRLRTEFDQLLSKMSKEIAGDKNRLVFLINNYDLIISVLSEIRIRATESELDHLRKTLANYTSQYAEEELKPPFGSMIAFLKEAEARNDDDVLDFDTSEMDDITKDFNATWRQKISNINISIIQNFSNFKNGTTVLHATLGQLAMYYTRYNVLYEKKVTEERRMNRNMPFKVHPVGVQAVMVEIKKFRSNF
ncbi:hypothetical protein BZG36_02697 [Bifiguratus adelaidae]|uniref:Vacuolar protein sorting-associated protein 52 A n=1 Tax=Bifiguratus adelaidae TaxID=1938954 RepID=A0A261Y1S1_9FUNG|nr:hypothetical protein BZG36_02697 [Bifiguratus adelaidae]